jgi:hypothetical protein
MVTGGIVVGTSTDFLVRRCLFPFVFMLGGGILNFFSMPYSRIAAWFGKKPWRYGIAGILIFELYGLYMFVTGPGMAEQSSAIFQNWISEWWIFLFALLFGFLGAYSGNRLAKRMHKRPQQNSNASSSED